MEIFRLEPREKMQYNQNGFYSTLLSNVSIKKAQGRVLLMENIIFAFIWESGNQSLKPQITLYATF